MSLAETCLYFSFCLILLVDGVIIPLGELSPVDPVFRVGENLTLNCTITNYNGPLDSSYLYFTSGMGDENTVILSQNYYSVLDPSTLQLVIPFASYGHENLYRCYLNDTSPKYFAAMKVRVGKMPNVITDLKVVSEDLENLKVMWCANNTEQDLVTYSLRWRNYDFGAVKECPHLLNSGPQCYMCVWTGAPFFIGAYYVMIEGSSIYGTSSNNFTIYPHEHIKPNSVQNLTIEFMNSTSVQVTWQRPQNYILIPLNFSLSYNKHSNMHQKDVILVSDSYFAFIGELLPGSTYSLSIKCIPGIGGVWSDDYQTTFSVPDGVPAVAPEFPSGWFYSSWCQGGTNVFHCLQDYHCHDVIFFWKPIPENLRYGKVLGYRIEYNSSESIWSNVTVWPSALVQLTLHKDYTFGLSAFTSAGSSATRYFYFPSSCQKMPEPVDLFAETTRDKRGIVIKWSSIQDISNYTLLYCLGKGRKCSGEPELMVISPDQTNVTMFNVTGYIFALAANTNQGSRGLYWICIFNYDGHVSAPATVDVLDQDVETAVLVKWSPTACNDPNLESQRGRPINYTITYKITGTDIEKNITVPGNETQCYIHNLSSGSNYTISVHGNSRFGIGQAKTVFHQLNTRTGILGNSEKIIQAALIPSTVIVVIIVLIVGIYLRRKLKKFCQLKIKTPSIVGLNTEHQENEKYTDNTYNYARLPGSLLELLLGSLPGREPVHQNETLQVDDSPECQQKLNMELLPMLGSSDNTSSYFEAKGYSMKTGDQRKIHCAPENSEEKVDIEDLLFNTSMTDSSLEDFCHSGQMGYASANLTHQAVLFGQPKPVNYDNSCKSPATTALVTDLECEDVNQDHNHNITEVIQDDSISSKSFAKAGNSISGDYSKANYAAEGVKEK